MPVYEYECLDCGLRFECLQDVEDRDSAKCPRGHRNVRRLFSPPAIVFKGSGFYVTDNRHGSGGSRKPSDEKKAS
jgi:putative FmdB family regulatory protein